MIEILHRGAVEPVKYRGSCNTCGTILKCDLSDVKTNTFGLKFLKCPVCFTSDINVFPIPSQIQYSVPPMIGPAYAGIPHMARTEIGDFIAVPNPVGTGDRL